MKKKRVIKSLLLGLGVVAGILFVIYAFLAWMPTGYERIAAGQEEAVEHANATIEHLARHPSGDLPPPSDSTTSNASPPLMWKQPGPNGAPVLKVDFINALEKLEKESDAVFRHGKSDPEHDNAYFAENAVSRVIRLTGGRYNSKSSADLPAPTDEDRKRLVAEAGCALANEIRERRLRRQVAPEAADSITTAPLQALLDHTEEFLLHSEWIFPPIQECRFVNPSSIRRFPMTCSLAIARAIREGDTDRAGKLLESYMKARNLIVYCGRTDAWFVNLLIPIASPMNLEAIPADNLIQAQRIADEGVLTGDAFDELLAVNAIRFRNVARKNMDEVRVDVKAGTWAFLYQGAPRWCIWQAAQPILSSQSERIATAWIKNDDIDYMRHFRQMWRVEILLRPMGIASPVTFDQLNWSRTNKKLIWIRNWETNEARLLLALARFRRDCGRELEYLEDLVPTYLGRDFPISEYTLIPLPPGRYPVLQSSYASAEQTGPFSKAINAFWVQKGRLPENSDELRELVSDPDDWEAFRDRFEWVEARLLICRAQVRPLYAPGTGGERYTSLFGQPYLKLLQDERDAIDRTLNLDEDSKRALVEEIREGRDQTLQQQYLDGFQVIILTATAPRGPWRSDELADLLQEDRTGGEISAIP